MISTYRLKSDEINSSFLESLKMLFQGQEIEIIARSIDATFEQEKKELRQALEEVEKGETLSMDEKFWNDIHSTIQAVS